MQGLISNPYSINVQPTSGGSMWLDRINAPGVMNYENFNSLNACLGDLTKSTGMSTFINAYNRGELTSTTRSYGAGYWAWDQSVKLSGAGSMRMDIGPEDGSYQTTPFLYRASTDLNWGLKNPGDELWFQVAWRCNEFWLKHYYLADSGTGQKMIVYGSFNDMFQAAGNGSVGGAIINHRQLGFPGTYNNGTQNWFAIDGQGSTGPSGILRRTGDVEGGWYHPGVNNDVPAIPTTQAERLRKYGPSQYASMGDQTNSGPTSMRQNIPNPDAAIGSTAINFDQWIVFTLRLKIVSNDNSDGIHEVWAGPYGGMPKLLWAQKDFNFKRTSTAGVPINGLQLTSCLIGKLAEPGRPFGSVWYGEIISSTKQIKHPGPNNTLIPLPYPNDLNKRVANNECIATYATDFSRVFVNGVETPSRAITNNTGTAANRSDGSLFGESSGINTNGNPGNPNLAIQWVDHKSIVGKKSLMFVEGPEATSGSSWFVRTDGTKGTGENGVTARPRIYYQETFFADRKHFADTNNKTGSGSYITGHKLFYLGNGYENGQMVFGTAFKYGGNFCWDAQVNGADSIFEGGVSGSVQSTLKIPLPNPWNENDLRMSTPLQHVINSQTMTLPTMSDPKTYWYNYYGAFAWGGAGYGLIADFDLGLPTGSESRYADQRPQVLDGVDQKWPMKCVVDSGAPIIHIDEWNTVEVFCEYNVATPNQSTVQLWTAKTGESPRLVWNFVGCVSFGSNPTSTWQQLCTTMYWTDRTADPTRPIMTKPVAEMIVSQKPIPFPGFVSPQGRIMSYPPGNLENNSSMFPLQVTAGQRYIKDAQGNPFFIVGATPWLLGTQIINSDIDYYLDDRLSKGYNTIMFELIEKYFSTDAPNNVYGDSPFTTPNDFSTPNSAYFDHIEYIINAARNRNMLCLITPAYTGYGGGQEGWWSVLGTQSQAVRYGYGQYIATRFQNYNNIIWVNGGDYNQVTTRVTDIVDGILSITPNALHTFHASRGYSAQEILGTSNAWLDINNIYTTTDTVVAESINEWNRSSMPYFLIEDGYEDATANSLETRQQKWQAVLSGACGFLYGQTDVWRMNSVWKTKMDQVGGSTLQFIKQLFYSYAWETLVPDLTNVFLTGGVGSNRDRVVAAIGGNGTFAFVYTNKNRQLTLNLTKLTNAPGQVQAQWYDPTNGVFTPIGNVDKTQTAYTITPPATNSLNSTDWVLVLG